ncbi:hypothetical protein LCGC14_2699010, partial [marine sediment metagenome]
MASTIVLVPKRKVSGFAGSADVAAVVKHVADSLSLPGSPPSTTVPFWTVTEVNKIPFGTDKFGSGTTSRSLQNFSAYTEVDPGSQIAVSDNVVS